MSRYIMSETGISGRREYVVKAKKVFSFMIIYVQDGVES
jgi:hypothetical protein